MESFRTLFGSLLTFVYHCFDRIVIQGYLPLLTRPEHIVHFFRDVHGIAPITKDVLIARTTEYRAWVEAFARDHDVPIAWAEAGVKKEDHVRPYLERFARRRRVGVYFIFRRSKAPSSTCSRRKRPIPSTGSSGGCADGTRISTSTFVMTSWVRW